MNIGKHAIGTHLHYIINIYDIILYNFLLVALITLPLTIIHNSSIYKRHKRVTITVPS